LDSVPHPFIALLQATKGKKILPRLTRHLNPAQMLTLLTLLVACFSQLDVVSNAALLDTLVESEQHAEMERQTQAFLASVLQSILPTVVKGPLRVISGLLGVLVDRNDIGMVVKSRVRCREYLILPITDN
jgi:DNA topoisomerase 2-associated protein PAT1